MTSLEEFAKAIEVGNSKKVEQLISTAAVDVNVRLPRHLNPPALVLAARFKQKEIVEILLRANARIDGADIVDCTGCHAAAAKGHVDVLATLLAAEPNLEAKDKYGDAPLARAVFLRHERCALMLIEAGARLENDLLCNAAALGTDMLHALVNRAVVVNELRGRSACTPLHVVAESERHRPALLSMLVHDCGVDVDARDSEGSTPCHYATWSSSGDNLRWLIEAGANFHLPNDRGETPLHEASRFQSVESVVLLIAAGANVHARDTNGRTPCHRVSFEHSSLMTILTILNTFVAGSGDLDAMDNSGTTVRQLLAGNIIAADIEAARRRIAKTRLDLIRNRALQICIGLQSLRLDALQMCEILQQSCCGGRLAELIPFHIWWKIATTVKHFHQ